MPSTARAFPELVTWFHQNKRVFPWREVSNPYYILLSEIMLQQTQAARVVPFFLRWIKKFPTVRELSQGSEDDILKLWEGLGYYSRARNLKKAACFIEEVFHGEIPKDQESLRSIPGIGPYTQGAIRSFAFHERAAAVDANVERVIARWMDVPIQKGSTRSREKVESLLEEILPEKDAWVVMEALIELGALVCQKKPVCEVCPLRKECLSLTLRSHVLKKV